VLRSGSQKTKVPLMTGTDLFTASKADKQQEDNLLPLTAADTSRSGFA
jgi:hypothetical protein